VSWGGRVGDQSQWTTKILSSLAVGLVDNPTLVGGSMRHAQKDARPSGILRDALGQSQIRDSPNNANRESFNIPLLARSHNRNNKKLRIVSLLTSKTWGSCFVGIRAWFKNGSGTVAGTAHRVLRTTIPDPFWNHADIRRICLSPYPGSEVQGLIPVNPRLTQY